MAANNLGTAYIKIAPQMQGIQKSISDGLAGIKSTSLPGATALGTVIAKGVSSAMNLVTSSLDGAIKRTDVLNNFPKVMQNLGISTEDAQKSINRLVEGLDGLPTALQDGATAVQRFTSRNNDIKKSTEIFLALNNAILAGGASAEIQTSALEQMSQAYAKGKPDMMEWRTMMMAMPAQLNQVAKSMGLGENAADKLGESLRKGGISMDAFMDEIIKLNKDGVDGLANFEDQARGATAGIGTALTNMRNRAQKAISSIIQSFGSKDISDAINKFSSSFAGIADWITKYMVPPIKEVVLPALKAVFGAISNLFKMIGENEVASKILAGVIYAFVGFKAVKSVVPIVKNVSNVIGGLASKLKIFKGAQTLGSGIGNIVASILKPLGSTEVLKGAASAALVAAGVWAFAEGIAKVSSAYIDWGKVVLLEVNMAAITAIIAAIGSIAGTGAIIGGVATAVISGGLWLFATALADLTPRLDRINWSSIYALTGHIAVLSGILTSFVALSAIGAIGAIADAVIGGGLLVAAIGLANTSVYAERINLEKIKKFAETVAEVGTILGLLAGFSIFGAIGSIADAVLSGGLLLSAIALEETQKHIGGLNSSTFQEFTDCLGQVSKALAIASLWSAFSAIGSVLNDVVAGGVLVAAIALESASSHIKKVNKEDYEKLSQVFKEISSWETGGIISSFSQMLSSGNLKDVANHVRETAEILNRVPELPDDDKINRLKDVIRNLSTIEIHGSGIFENKGGAAEELEKIVGHVVNIGLKLAELPWIDYDKTARLVDCIKVFDRIDDACRNGIERLADLRSSFENILIITYTLTKAPDNLVAKAEMVVQAMQRLSGFNAEAISIEAAASAVGKLLSALVIAMANGKSRMEDAGKALALAVRDGVGSMTDQFADVAQNLQGSFWGALEAKFQDEYYQGRALADKVKSGVDSIINEGAFRSSGQNAGAGLIGGLRDTFTSAYQAGRNIAQRIIDGIRARGQEGSPWKTTFQSGVFAGQGLAEGILAAKDDVTDAAMVLADATQNALGLDGRGFSVGGANTHLLPQTDLTSGIRASGGQVIQNNEFYVDSELDVKEVSKRLGWQVATAL